ncbi:PilW family protein [Pseudomonadota bacterium]
MIRPHKNQEGFTLVELMIAMVLSLLLMAGAGSMFLGSKKTFKVQEESARIQENVRYVVTRMITDISPAGFYGCAPSAQDGSSQIESTVASSDGLYTFDESITGIEGGGPNNSDSLTVRFARPEFSLPIIAPMTALDRAVRVDSNHPAYDELEEGDIIAVSDCGLLAAFMITNEPGGDGRIEHTVGPSVDGVSNSTEGTTHYFGGEPHSTATVIKMDAVTYDLGTTTNTQDTSSTDDDTTISSLYATRLGGNRDEILSGVENFQVTYGIDDSNPPDSTSDRYVTWTNAQALQNRIASIRISLAINSGNPISGTTGINQNFTENIEFTVKLRNRLTDL